MEVAVRHVFFWGGREGRGAGRSFWILGFDFLEFVCHDGGGMKKSLLKLTVSLGNGRFESC